MRAWMALAAGGAGVALVGFALLSGKTDAERIAEQIAALEAAVAVDGDGTNPVMRTSAVNGAFKEIFTKDVTYSIPDLTSGSEGRGGLAQLAAGASRYVRTLDIDFGSIEMDIAEGMPEARVRTTATITAERRSGEFERDTRKVVFLFTKDDDWMISDVRVRPNAD